MKEGPNIAAVGALVGDPARANILTALMTGQALTASELATECGVTPQTVSSHLAKLESGGLIRLRKQGRHRYFTLSGDDVARLLEAMMGLAASRGHTRIRTGPREPELRKARVCYNHLAGDYGVRMLDVFLSNGYASEAGDDIVLEEKGRGFVTDFGIDLSSLEGLRRPLCKSCLDWSARRSHLAGSLGSAILDRIIERKWAKRLEGSRVVSFSQPGERDFLKLFSYDT